jgi:transposase
MVELVHAGRPPEELAQEFEPTAQSIRNWVAQTAMRANRSDGLTTAEREELNRLRRENRQLRLEREILSKAVIAVLIWALLIGPPLSTSASHP